MTSLDGYELLSDYSGVIVEIRKDDSTNPFITTPWGFLTGWRDPSDDPNDEAEKFREVVNLACDDEFEPLDPPSQTVRFLHKNCGEVIVESARNVTDHGLTCSCQEKSFLNTEYAREKVEQAGNYELLSVGNDKTLTIRSLDCGHVFNVDAALWARHPGCRECFKERHDSTVFKYRNSAADTSYDSTEAFKREVAAAASDEYEVTGDYMTAVKPVSILHKKCGHTKLYLPVHFLHGARCGCEKFRPRGTEFLEYVKVRSCGRYEICGRDEAKRYLIRDTVSGNVKAMTRAYIIQELERPLSFVLPLEEKGPMIDPDRMYIEKAVDYLSCITGEDGIFDRKDLHVPGISERKLISVIRTLKEQNIIEKANGSLYKFNGYEGLAV